MHKFSKWHGLGSCSEISGICGKDKKAFVNFCALIRQVRHLLGRNVRSGSMSAGRPAPEEFAQ